MQKTLIVSNASEQEQAELRIANIDFETYLREYPKRNESRTRVINLCDTEKYLSQGYYCSLLAEARGHLVLPSVKTINELRRTSDVNDTIRLYAGALSPESEEAQTHYLFFGKANLPTMQKLATRLFQQFPCPILVLSTAPGQRWNIKSGSLADLDDANKVKFHAALEDFTKTIWRINPRQKRYRWDMAILINPDEESPPSNREALTRFVKAAGKLGIHAETLTIQQIHTIAQYDALFIRETTAIDHYTYRLARQAEREGLVVIDDPDSILRCCNKIFLQDAFSYQGVPNLRAEVVSQVMLTETNQATVMKLETELGYPMVLKMPESSFSRGVFKVKNREELLNQLQMLFQESALVLVQEYLFTEFDWRIGILNGRAIYACRYLMARNHWQIYNHSAKRFKSGDFECLPTFEVPKLVLEAAIKAARVIGNGLYGVDVKQKDKHAYVLEVNDNPSIEHKVEDAYLGDELYMQIMNEFQSRLEERGR